MTGTPLSSFFLKNVLIFRFSGSESLGSLGAGVPFSRRGGGDREGDVHGSRSLRILEETADSWAWVIIMLHEKMFVRVLLREKMKKIKLTSQMPR